jgi:Na+/melibiose symporter-like transporter
LSIGGQSSWGQAFAFVFLYYFKSSTMLTWYNGVSRMIGMIANVTVMVFARKLKPRHAFIFAHAWQVMNYLVIYFLAEDALTAIILIAVTQVFSQINTAGTPAIYADIAEYTRWKTGENIADQIFSIQQSTAKTSTYIANFMITGLAAIGFSAADATTHTPEILASLKSLACLLPAGLYGLGLLVFLLIFQLKPKTMDNVRKELSERDAAAAASDASG